MSVNVLARINADGVVDLDRLIPNRRDGGFHPHRVDILVPSGTLTRSLVGLHGGDGNKRQQAFYEGFLKEYVETGSFAASNVNWRWLQQFNCIAVFPQGQACRGANMAYSVNADGSPNLTWPTLGNPWNPGDLETRNADFPDGQTGWQNGFENVGTDDVQFLTDLENYIATTYGITGISLSGHSSGGFMVKLMWLLHPSVYGHYITWAGPLAGAYASTAMPGLIRKLLCIQGYLDTTVGAMDYDTGVSQLYADVWQQDPTHITRNDVVFPNRAQNHGDWPLLVDRVTAVTGVAPLQSDKAVTTAHIGDLWTYSYDSGNQQLLVLTAATHDFKSITQCLGKGSLFITAMAWIVGTTG